MSNSLVAKQSVGQEVKEYWRDLVAKYQQPSIWRSSWQLTNTLIPFIGLWTLAYLSLGVSYWLTLLLALPAAGLLVRVFIISHDCGHGAFFQSGKANAFWGSVTSFLCFSPYHYWRHEHALHHAGTGNLDRRGHGDIWTMTVQEYLDAPRRTRLAYRFYRNPFVMFVVGAIYSFLIDYRMAPKSASAKVRASVLRTNLTLLAALVLIYFTIGFKAFLMVHLPILLVAGSAGVWLFYVQHQYEGVYWARKEDWDFVTASLDGSSFYKMPAILNWFTGSIGYHHIHHLSSKIPNYNLARCHWENPVFQKVHKITLLSSLKCLKYRLWDEERGELVGYSRLREYQRAA